MAVLLSVHTSTGLCTAISKSFNSPNIQMISVTVVAMLLYSASAELLETIDCFLDFHDTTEIPNLIKYSVTDFLVRGQDAQSASQKAVRLVS